VVEDQEVSRAMQAQTALYVKGISKRYGGIQALHPLDLSIPSGSVFALLGSNGAGKTTFMKSVLGLVCPDSGEAAILGKDFRDPASRSGVRYLPESVRFSNWATPLFMFGQIERVRRESGESDLRSVAALLHCEDLLGRQFGRMSQGQVQRTAISLAASGEPAFLFLDEPSNGLDPEGRILLRNLIKSRASDGATVILNSHLLGEVEAVCDRAAFLQQGRIAASGEIESLLRYKGIARIQTAAPDAMLDLLGRAGFRATAAESALTVPVRDEDDFRAIASAVTSSHLPFTSLELVRESLEDLFLRLVSTVDGSRR
jgi:ABC-2 type transport system ATP-binding protein